MGTKVRKQSEIRTLCAQWAKMNLKTMYSCSKAIANQQYLFILQKNRPTMPTFLKDKATKVENFLEDKMNKANTSFKDKANELLRSGSDHEMSKK